MWLTTELAGGICGTLMGAYLAFVFYVYRLTIAKERMRMAAFDLPDQVGPLRAKPDDCTCRFPDALARNPTLHAKRCPAYRRIYAEATGDGGEYVNRRNILPDSLSGEPFLPLVPSSAFPQGVPDTFAADERLIDSAEM